MNRKLKWIAGGAAAAAVVITGTGIGLATVADDDGTETPITGDALDRASRAALEHTGGGRVTETEVGDEEGYYEVEVTLEDGSQVDVHLDRDFNVLGSAGDRDGADDDVDDDDD
jgi:uncharacterized membrane protein YkoI